MKGVLPKTPRQEQKTPFHDLRDAGRPSSGLGQGRRLSRGSSNSSRREDGLPALTPGQSVTKGGITSRGGITPRALTFSGMRGPLSQASARSTSGARAHREIGELVIPVAPPDGHVLKVVAAEQTLTCTTAEKLKLVRYDQPMPPNAANAPGPIHLDIQRHQSVQSLMASSKFGILHITLIDLRFSPKLAILPPEFIAELPQLGELRLQQCSALRSLGGLDKAQKLEKLYLQGCGSLETLGISDNGTDPAPNLVYVDMYGCHKLPNNQAWQLTESKLGTRVNTTSGGFGSIAFLGKSMGHDRSSPFREHLTSCVQIQPDRAACPGKHPLSQFSLSSRVEDKKDFRCSVCTAQVQPGTRVFSCMRCSYFACSRCLARSNEQHLFAVWSDPKQIPDALALAGAKKTALHEALTQGIKEKLRKSLACGLEAVDQGGAPALREEEIKNDIVDAVTVADTLKVNDFQILQQAIPALAKYLPERVVPCLLGCGMRLKAKDVSEHQENECVNRLEMCTLGCGQLVRAKHREHHEQVEKELQDSLGTWDYVRINSAFKMATTHCAGCRLPGDILDPALSYSWNLKRKIKMLRDSQVLTRGNVSIDYQKCMINIEKTIPFENRKEPDTSAEFKSGDEESALIIIRDLAIVLNIFKSTMVIEGHTGATEPRKYWTALANNRSKLICQILFQQKVPRACVIAKGVPGGGAKVLVKPATLQEVFESFDTDGSGKIDIDELQAAEELLGKFMSPQQIAAMLDAADENEDGEIDFEEFMDSVKHLI